MRTIFVSATRASKKEDTLLGKTFIEQLARTGRTHELEMVCNNTTKLSEIYNRYITPEYKDCIVVFVHDDVTFNVLATAYELDQALTDNDVIGLAGCTTANISQPALWHIMGPRNCLSGAVAHPIARDAKEIFMSAYGPYPQRCVMMDGLFLAAKVNSLLQSNVKFDTKNPAIAHFYDLDFCLSCNKAKLKLTTWPIYVTHRSPGLLSTEDVQWKAGQEWFLNKWKK